MAAPNIVDVTTITGKTAYVAVGTSETQLVSNAASSNKVFKINMIQITNVDGTSAADITVELYPAATNSGTSRHLASTISVPADSSIIIIDKSTSLYLEEDRSIYVTASAASDLEAVVSYEEIS
tara:strand:- start:471 stop:842 length:372 start_codon:yes stop_codon:yes gene_type:complete